MKTITLAQLRQARACSEQCDLFEQMFGKQVTVTVELAREHSAIFDWDWAASRLLSPADYEAYRAAVAPALATYKVTTDLAWATYKVTRDSAWATYKAATDLAWATYKAATAVAFAEAYLADEGKQP